MDRSVTEVEIMTLKTWWREKSILDKYDVGVGTVLDGPCTSGEDRAGLFLKHLNICH